MGTSKGTDESMNIGDDDNDDDDDEIPPFQGEHTFASSSKAGPSQVSRLEGQFPEEDPAMQEAILAEILHRNELKPGGGNHDQNEPDYQPHLGGPVDQATLDQEFHKFQEQLLDEANSRMKGKAAVRDPPGAQGNEEATVASASSKRPLDKSYASSSPASDLPANKKPKHPFEGFGTVGKKANPAPVTTAPSADMDDAPMELDFYALPEQVGDAPVRSVPMITVSDEVDKLEVKQASTLQSSSASSNKVEINPEHSRRYQSAFPTLDDSTQQAQKSKFAATPSAPKRPAIKPKAKLRPLQHNYRASDGGDQSSHQASPKHSAANEPRSQPLSSAAKPSQSPAQFWQEYSTPLAATQVGTGINAGLTIARQPARQQGANASAQGSGSVRSGDVDYPITRPPAQGDVPFSIVAPSCCLLKSNDDDQQGTWSGIGDRAQGNNSADWGLRAHFECARPDKYERFISLCFSLDRKIHARHSETADTSRPGALTDQIRLKFTINALARRSYETVRPLPVVNLRCRGFADVFPRGTDLPDVLRETKFPSLEPRHLLAIEWESDRAEFNFPGGPKALKGRGYSGAALESIKALQGVADVLTQIRLICWMKTPETRLQTKSLAIPYLSYGADVEKSRRDDKREHSKRQKELREGTGTDEDSFTTM